MKNPKALKNRYRAYFWRLPLYLILPLYLMGCTQPVVSDASKPSTLPEPSAKPNLNTTTKPSSTPTPPASSKPQLPQPNPQLAQSLPITAKAEIAGRTVQLEVARTFAEQAKGLMYRPALPDDRGMLFPFDPTRQIAFWMKNVPVDLDMVFLYKGEVKAIAHSAPPCVAEPCAIYPSEGVVADQVIELRAGWAMQMGVKVGDRIVVTPLTP
ncbi:DUF192 domain-containing protein [Tumidithrix elongata RA019]|uniref:DUF192 domain-containing protein n=1 Tax=Tumidithrix elongata BACA0141 TaxID=2716417 RepID=A0AAW9PP08_9CYAN|nr:DUF192 domain-containing protein [Tumidithrix elongata RA019]